MDEDLFAGGNQPSVDPNKNYLEELVGEGKKFKTVEDLARGKYEADLFVETLRNQTDELRNDYLRVQEENAAKARLEELIAQLRQPNQGGDNTQTANTGNTPKPQEHNLDELISSKFEEIEMRRKQSANFREVQNKLKEKFGDQSQAFLKEQMENLGLTPKFVNDLARNHPSVFYKTMGIEDQVKPGTFQTPPRTTQSQFAPKVEKRTWSWYEKLKKDNPRLYWETNTQKQLHKDRIELGDAFGDGNW